MGLKLGINGKLYRDSSSTPATPTWNPVDNCMDLTLNVEAGEWDATTRGAGGWEAAVPTLFKGGVDFNLPWDTANDDLIAMRTAFFARTPVQFAVMDGDITTAGSEGLKAMFMISKFSRNEGRADGMTVDVTIKPTYHATVQPTWLVVSA